ncbi:MAG: hemerythrin family protein [Candidatus Moraniibacteriota bacterium]|nr:MAG: hemerythrin family protein [Candidatus Moranbacteria bacterium]
MAFIWSDEYNLGIERIDKQHKHFARLIEKLHNAINNTTFDQELEGIMVDLVEYAQYHFKTEEFYFDLYQYEFSEEHKEEHKKLLQKALDFQKQYKEERVISLEEFTEFLEDWLVDHMGGQDRKYIQCFREHGLS